MSARTLANLTIVQLLCRIHKHAWRDIEMLPYLWGESKVERWWFECDRGCGVKAWEYRDPSTCARIGQRQYERPPSYILDYRYTQQDALMELRARRMAEKGLTKSGRKKRRRAG